MGRLRTGIQTTLAVYHPDAPLVCIAWARTRASVLSRIFRSWAVLKSHRCLVSPCSGVERASATRPDGLHLHSMRPQPYHTGNGTTGHLCQWTLAFGRGSHEIRRGNFPALHCQIRYPKPMRRRCPDYPGGAGLTPKIKLEQMLRELRRSSTFLSEVPLLLLPRFLPNRRSRRRRYAWRVDSYASIESHIDKPLQPPAFAVRAESQQYLTDRSK